MRVWLLVSMSVCFSVSLWECVCVCVLAHVHLGAQVSAAYVDHVPQPPCAPFCRTATVWRSLSPFWGEEYTVHLPLDFHHLAFYVLDEDTVGCVCRGPKPGHLRGGGHPTAQYPPGCPTLDACPFPDLVPPRPPFHRHDDIIGKISLSREAIAADPRGGRGAPVLSRQREEGWPCPQWAL